MSEQSPFPVTQWTSVILVIQQGDEEKSREAIERFCEGYHGAIRKFFIMRGAAPDQADDLTQEFFLTKVLRTRGGLILEAEKERGKFRTFLRMRLMAFTADEFRKQQAIKRGGGARRESIDDPEQSDSLAAEWSVAHDEDRFNAAFGETLIDRFMEGERNRKLLEAFLTEASPKDLAREWDMSEGAVRVQLFRFREWLRRSLRAEVQKTLGPGATEEDINEEIRLLMKALLRKVVTSPVPSADTLCGGVHRSPPVSDAHACRTKPEQRGSSEDRGGGSHSSS